MTEMFDRCVVALRTRNVITDDDEGAVRAIFAELANPVDETIEIALKAWYRDHHINDDDRADMRAAFAAVFSKDVK
jgi:hypothetical protein